MIRICTCGHFESDHGRWEGTSHLPYETACLVLSKDKIKFECVSCVYFKMDNLKSLEKAYEQKTL